MKTLIAVPCHDYVHADFARSLIELEKPAGTGFAMITNTLIYTARNLIAQNAVKAGFDNVLWLDADMTFPDDTLIRLSEDLEEGREMVSALYFTRKEPIVPTLHKEIHWRIKDDGWVDGGATLYMDYPMDRMFEVAGCGFGCVMTSTRLLARMIEKFGSPFYPLMGMGEDTTFCFRATEDGAKIYCDSRIKCGHIGQYEFTEETWFDQEHYGMAKKGGLTNDGR
jgi:glycosyltransferase involved in cell wall biosynthesis